jgi:hypothetical protein
MVGGLLLAPATASADPVPVPDNAIRTVTLEPGVPAPPPGYCDSRPASSVCPEIGYVTPQTHLDPQRGVKGTRTAQKALQRHVLHLRRVG